MKSPLIKRKTKSTWGYLSSPRRGAEGASSTLTSFLTRTNALTGETRISSLVMPAVHQRRSCSTYRCFTCALALSTSLPTCLIGAVQWFPINSKYEWQLCYTCTTSNLNAIRPWPLAFSLSPGATENPLSWWAVILPTKLGQNLLAAAEPLGCAFFRLDPSPEPPNEVDVMGQRNRRRPTAGRKGIVCFGLTFSLIIKRTNSCILHANVTASFHMLLCFLTGSWLPSSALRALLHGT